MGSGKRASMREGPLANLFRKTETEGLEPQPQRPIAEEPRVEQPREEPAVPERATPAQPPTPQERLRHAFSTDVPGDMMAPPEEPPAPPAPPASDEYQWGSVSQRGVGTPQLRV